MQKLYILLITLLMSACAQMPTFIPGADKNNSDGSEFGEKSTLYVFRSENTLAPGFSFAVVIDEGSMASLMKQQFAAIPVTSGSHIINFDCRFPCGATPKFKIDVEKGKTYYLLFAQSINHTYLKFISKDEAEPYIKKYQKIPLTPLTSTGKSKSSKVKKVKKA
ncbi:MAG: hypothetical protein V4732_16495 [Pseudomonadota bacterium]